MGILTCLQSLLSRRNTPINMDIYKHPCAGRHLFWDLCWTHYEEQQRQLVAERKLHWETTWANYLKQYKDNQMTKINFIENPQPEVKDIIQLEVGDAFMAAGGGDSGSDIYLVVYPPEVGGFTQPFAINLQTGHVHELLYMHRLMPNGVQLVDILSMDVTIRRAARCAK